MPRLFEEVKVVAFIVLITTLVAHGLFGWSWFGLSLMLGVGWVWSLYLFLQDNRRLLRLKARQDRMEDMGRTLGHPPPQRLEARQFRCYKCPEEPWCLYAWDDYNTGGDCLREK